MPNIDHITSLVMQKIQFNPFPFISLWQSNQEAGHHNFSYFELPLPKQILNKLELYCFSGFEGVVI